MALTFGLTSARDLLGKLRRDASLLDKEVTTDRFFNFVITGYSMVDWIKNDPSVPQAAKAQYANLHTDYWLSICGDIANACKHFILTSTKSNAQSATSTQGYGQGRYGKGNYSEGEESILVRLDDGTTYICLELVQNVLSTWERFFSTYGI
jgi:hypothetical protein